MRYAAVTAAVFGSAMILAPSSHASSTDAHNTNNLSQQASITNIIAMTHPTVANTQTATQTKPTSKTLATVRLAAAKSAAATPPAPDMVPVNAGDSLTKVAEAHGSTVQRLYDANLAVEDPNMIYPGQQLRIPAANEQLADRPMPAPAANVQAAVAPTPRAAAPAPSYTPSPAPAAATIADGSVWDSLAQCESGGNWAINTGNSFYGGLQFTLATWQGLGGAGLPSQASREEQISRAQVLQARSGWGQWPACAAKLGLL
jgi:LysM repeat protein